MHQLDRLSVNWKLLGTVNNIHFETGEILLPFMTTTNMTE